MCSFQLYWLHTTILILVIKSQAFGTQKSFIIPYTFAWHFKSLSLSFFFFGELTFPFPIQYFSNTLYFSNTVSPIHTS